VTLNLELYVLSIKQMESPFCQELIVQQLTTIIASKIKEVFVRTLQQTELACCHRRLIHASLKMDQLASNISKVSVSLLMV
jgi:hypothetical protein